MEYRTRSTAIAVRIRPWTPPWPLLAFAGVLALAAFGSMAPTTAEVELTRAIQGADPAPLRWSAVTMTAIGLDPWFSLIALASVIAVWWRSRSPSLALFLALAVLLRAVSPMVKAIVDRPRPTSDLVDVASTLGSPSYPSGHVLGATLLFGFLIYCVERTVPAEGPRRAIQAVLVSLILLMGHARVEMGHHWPTDVIGGWLIGAILLAGLVWGHRRWEARHARA